MNAISRQRFLEKELPRQATIREQFAMAALTGLLARGERLDTPDDYASMAWELADRMIALRPSGVKISQSVPEPA